MSITCSLSSMLRLGLSSLFIRKCVFTSDLANKAYHSFIGSSASCLGYQLSSSFLVPNKSHLIPERGLKYKGVLRRRCKDCYFVVRDERMYVMCKTHPRHKQACFKKPEKHRWILTHATQSQIRPW